MPWRVSLRDCGLPKVIEKGAVRDFVESHILVVQFVLPFQDAVGVAVRMAMARYDE